MSRSVSVVTNEGSDLSLEYDGYGRVAKKVLTREGRTILTVEYTYRNTDANSTTGQIASITIGTNGASRSYTYSYDANGNITSVTEGNNATTYTYDKAGQLLRENNQAAGKTWVWEYDAAGNIESRTEYAYTTGNLGAVLDTVEYQYNNDNWGDLLTSYDGNAITYDQIGNPLNDGTWEYTWEHGRQLASMTDGTVTVDYEYNADGIRTRKTVSTASDHSHIFQARVVAPTCTENGYTLHECSCGYSWQSNPVASTGHSFTTTEVEATCTEHGYTLKACECGYGYQEGTSGHTFTDTVVAPTAEENGYTLHSCECGYSYQDTPVAALGITNPTANGTAANTVVYDYIYNGSSLTYLAVTTTQFGQDSVTDTLYFGNGTVTYNETVYYYVTNLQGDVVAIIDADGNPKVQYTYDAWGKILSISGPMADTLGAINPLTYRGYVYDAETDLYYLQSRYYDPTVERFVNADALVSTGQGFVGNNMFAYCGNNPVIYSDFSGEFPWLIILGAAISMTIGGILGANSEIPLGPSGRSTQETLEQLDSITYTPFAIPPRTKSVVEITPDTQTSFTPSSMEIPVREDFKPTLTTGQRIENTLLGAGLGLAAYGGILVLVGAGLCIGEAAATVTFLGVTGLQAVACGALCYNVLPMLIAPFFGMEIEPLEINP